MITYDFEEMKVLVFGTGKRYYGGKTASAGWCPVILYDENMKRKQTA